MSPGRRAVADSDSNETGKPRFDGGSTGGRLPQAHVDAGVRGKTVVTVVNRAFGNTNHMMGNLVWFTAVVM